MSGNSGLRRGGWGLCFAIVMATPALSADAANGKQIALRWCQTCHVVADTQTQVGGEGTPFSELANRPDFDANKIAMFLMDPHPRMPNMSLTRMETADLAAYIATFKRK